MSNAVYHRSYELREPIEVRVLPDVIEIISYNGVDPSIKQADFDRGVIRARRYRNRRIGEFLKELRLTEGRGTGIPTILKVLKANGSDKPRFDTDDPDRRHFIIEIPIQEEFKTSEEKDSDRSKDEGGVIGGAIGGVIGGAIGGAIELTDRQREVLDLINRDAKISYTSIAKELGINESAVGKHIDALKVKGVLERKGGTRGLWKINTK